LVLDASVALSWCFPDEQTQKAEVIAERIAAGEVADCRKHGLASYDAAYLEIATRGKYQLAAVDNALMNAARAEGVGLLC
jgi:predicted nucleic acid-binding protein